MLELMGIIGSNKYVSTIKSLFVWVKMLTVSFSKENKWLTGKNTYVKVHSDVQPDNISPDPQIFFFIFKTRKRKYDY